MKQLSIFEKLPQPILEKEWFKDHIKNPPPFSSDEQRKKAQEKLNQYSSLRTARNEAGSNLTNKLQLS